MKKLPGFGRAPAWPGRKGSVRTQLIAWNVGALALLLIALGLTVRYTVFSFMIGSVDRELNARLQHDLGPMPPRPGGPPPDAPPREEDGPEAQPPPGDEADRAAPEEGRPAGPPVQRPPRPGEPAESAPFQDRVKYRPRRFDLSGRSLDDAEKEAPWDTDAFTRAKLGEAVRSTTVADGEPVRALYHRFPAGGPIEGVIQETYPLRDVFRAMSGLKSALLTLIPLGLLCAGLAGGYLTDRVLRRVVVMSRVAGRMGASDFSGRLPVMGNDEFSELAETFNRLLGRLETAYKHQERLLEQQRRFTADASHELKTPLTIIKGNTSMALSAPSAEGAVRKSMEEIDRAASSMSCLVQDLLLLARLDGGRSLGGRIELLAREVIERAIMRIPQREHVPIELVIPDAALTLQGDEEELVRLFANLLDNAVRYTPPGGCITVHAERENDRIVVTVADNGIGIEPEHLPHLGERFYRVDSSRTRPTGGTGLGLSICRSIVEAHAGTIAFSSMPGKGTTVTVRLPLPQS